MVFNFKTHTLVKTVKSIAEIIVGRTKFFLESKNIEMQTIKTKILIIKSASDNTPAGKTTILATRAANVA